MGADFEDQEAAIKEIAALSLEAKALLCHHFGNSLQAILTEAQMNNLNLSICAVNHIIEDMIKFGIRRDIG